MKNNDVCHLHFLIATLVLALLLFLLITQSESAEVIKYPAGVPDERAAVETLIDQFDSKDVVVTQHPVMEIPVYIPAFVVHARACAKLDGALEPLIEMLAGGTLQSRVAAGVALKEIGADAIAASSVLRDMLGGTTQEKRLAAGVIEGIGREASSLIHCLTPNLYSRDFHTQYWTCRALASIGPGACEAIPDLCYLVEYGVASVRKNACLALGSVSPGTDMESLALLTLEKASSDFSFPVRQAAEKALGNF